MMIHHTTQGPMQTHSGACAARMSVRPLSICQAPRGRRARAAAEAWRPVPEPRTSALSITATACCPVPTWKDATTHIGTTTTTGRPTRPRVVVLGSGWAAMSFIKALPSNSQSSYEIILVSPRNYFLYTPLLPAVATGTMEERSIVEPVRSIIAGKCQYYEAACQKIDPVNKELELSCDAADMGDDGARFRLQYDVLILGVGCVNNTFGIQGVQQYCNYFKSVEDAHKLRSRVSDCFERASLPATPAEERRRLLSFVVVGGGPTGVEVAAELQDHVHDDLAQLYPALVRDVRIRVVELTDHVLASYSPAISAFTGAQLERAGIELVLNSRVVSVQAQAISIVQGNNLEEVHEIPFGACVWATGVAMNPLIRALQPLLPGQNHPRCLLTDGLMRVKGSDGSIFAIGDSSSLDQPRAADHSAQLFAEADVDHDQRLSSQELRDILEKASARFPHLREQALSMESMALGLFSLPRTGSPQPQAAGVKAVNQEEFKELLTILDKRLRTLPPTAQVAAQQGSYLAHMMVRNKITGDPETTVVGPSQRPFVYFHKGSTAYVGSDNAVFDVPVLGPLYGWYAGLMWKGFETYSQISLRNRCLVFMDWLRCKLFGRDISHV